MSKHTTLVQVAIKINSP